MSVMVKINGVLSHVLDPEKSGGFWGWINDTTDSMIGKEVEWIFKPLGNALSDGFMGIVHLINSCSVEIIVLGVMFASIGMIVAPLMGSTSARWFGRVIFVMLTGSIWRILL